MLVYYGLAAILKNYMDMFSSKYSQLIYTAQLILGIVMLVSVSYILMNKKVKLLESKISSLKGDIEEGPEANDALLKFKSLNPVSLFLIGSVATICELPTALPYFAFLAIILNYELPIITVVLIMLLYNFIYSSPLMLLYLLYVKCQDRVDKFYTVIKEKMTMYSNILTPLVVGGIGCFLIYDSVIKLLS
jgi:cytochrome c biogenesis protein CcdA